jgi:hypothetical protein
MFHLKTKKMKNVFFALFVSSVFALASCGGPSAEEQKALQDSIANALNDALNQAQQVLDTAIVMEEVADTTVQN